MVNEVDNRSCCCDGMKNAVALGAIKLHNERPEAVTSDDESTNEHFPFKCCPFCCVSYDK